MQPFLKSLKKHNKTPHIQVRRRNFISESESREYEHQCLLNVALNMENTVSKSVINAKLALKELCISVSICSNIYIIIIVSVRLNIRLSCFAEVNIENSLSRAVKLDIYSDRILDLISLN